MRLEIGFRNTLNFCASVYYAFFVYLGNYTMIDQPPPPPFMPPMYPAMYPPPMIGPGGRPMAPPVPWMHDVCNYVLYSLLC